MESDEAVALWERTRGRLAPLLDRSLDGDLPDLEPVEGAVPAEPEPPPPALFTILGKVAALSGAALLAGAEEFARTWSPVGILPPDQYMALVVQLTRGCRFNACTFCAFYRDTPFSVTDGAGLREHLARIDSFLGAGISLRRSIFLGDANALVLPTEELLPLLDIVAERYRGTPPWNGGMHTFLDGFSGAKKDPDEYRQFREKGLRRTCIGMESGHDPLLRWLNKPGTADDVITTVTAMKVAGLEVSLVILLGAGGREYRDGHIRDTIDVLGELPLDSKDVVYFSRHVEMPGAVYGMIARQEGITALDDSGMAEQQRIIASALRPFREGGPRQGSYDIREFTY